MKSQYGGGLVGFIFVLLLAVFVIYGWIANIVVIFHADFARLTGVLVLRIIGVFVPIIGGVMGYI